MIILVEYFVDIERSECDLIWKKVSHKESLYNKDSKSTFQHTLSVPKLNRQKIT